jgi:hypothetical protein
MFKLTRMDSFHWLLLGVQQVLLVILADIKGCKTSAGKQQVSRYILALASTENDFCYSSQVVEIIRSSRDTLPICESTNVCSRENFNVPVCKQLMIVPRRIPQLSK